jgi:hypothetical protein
MRRAQGPLGLVRAGTDQRKSQVVGEEADRIQEDPLLSEGKTNNLLIHEPVVHDCSGSWKYICICRHVWNEVLRIEVFQLIATHTAGQYRYVVYISVRYHRIEGGLRILCGKFVTQVLVPYVFD